MTTNEQTCALRALNLCDGQAVVDHRRASQTRPCYCRVIATLERNELAPVSIADFRVERARTVARADELVWRRDRTQRWLGSPGEF